MSWMQFRDEIWPSTNDEAELRLHLRAPDVGCPRQAWHLRLFHTVPAKDHAEQERGCQRYMELEIPDLGLHQQDWRRLSGLEIRADAAWHDAHEHVSEHGQLECCTVSAHLAAYDANAPKNQQWTRTTWRGHDFVLRFGTLDGWCLPCELDAWLLPEEGYYRNEPEPDDAVARFAAGPPTLRVLTRAMFAGSSVNVPRCAEPVPWARRLLREETGLDLEHPGKVSWARRQTTDLKNIVPMPGWRSTVHFATRPVPPAPKVAP